jgi:predicted RecA/RadA family phage recombinase
MAKATFVQDGDAINYTPETDLASGSVVAIGDLIGITRTEIKANNLGSLAVAGVFDIAKDPDEVITAGTKVYWKSDDQIIVTLATGNKLVGKTIAEAPEGATTARVLLTH